MPALVQMCGLKVPRLFHVGELVSECIVLSLWGSRAGISSRCNGLQEQGEEPGFMGERVGSDTQGQSLVGLEPPAASKERDLASS